MLIRFLFCYTYYTYYTITHSITIGIIRNMYYTYYLWLLSQKVSTVCDMYDMNVIIIRNMGIIMMCNIKYRDTNMGDNMKAFNLVRR